VLCCAPRRLLVVSQRRRLHRAQGEHAVHRPRHHTPRAPKEIKPGAEVGVQRDGGGIGRRSAVPQSVFARACIHIHE
jgi:hypothetical protein